jgi:hypothetical protein
MYFRPISVGLTVFPSAAGRYELDTQSTAGAYNLRIVNVSFADDNGTFFCQLTDPNGNNYDAPAQVVVLG